MTEAEWLRATDPTPIMEFLRGKASDRKLRLFSCAAVRLVWTKLGEELPSAIEVAEEFADGIISKAALRRSRHAVRDKRHGLELAGMEAITLWAAYWLAETASTLNAFGSIVTELNRLSSDTHPFVAPDWPAVCDCLRDIIYPYRHVALDPTWRTEAVITLAKGIYASRAFDRMPVLADALEDAGCVNEEILSHCRSDGPHVRGCWVVDLILGKN